MSSYQWPSSSPDRSAPLALILPGTGYTAKAPLLYWCAEILSDRGWRVEAVEWDGDPGSVEAPREDVENEIDRVISATGTTPTLVVAKSFGTLAFPWAIAHGLPGVWLTPVLSDPDIKAALASASSAHFAAGGSADEFWTPAAEMTTHAVLHTVPGADHSIRVDVGWEASLAAQTQLFQVIERHLDRLAAKPPSAAAT
jgi:hypothetical protein